MKKLSKTRKKGNNKRIPLSNFAKKAIAQLRKAPPLKTGFSLYITSEETNHSITVIDRGKGPDSAYYIHRTKSATVPQNLPPTSTYLVSTDAELDSVLAVFADCPDLYSRPGTDALDSGAVAQYDDSDPRWGNSPS